MTTLVKKTKKEFLENAKDNGLAMLGISKKSLEEIVLSIEEHYENKPYNGIRDDCSYCGQTMKRKFMKNGQEITSHLYLTRYETIYYHTLGFWFVNTIKPETALNPYGHEQTIIYA